MSGGTETDPVTFHPPCFMTSAERLFHFWLGEEGLITEPILSSPLVRHFFPDFSENVIRPNEAQKRNVAYSNVW